MKVDVTKSITIQIEDKEAELFETMLRLALKGWDRIKENSRDSKFVIPGVTGPTSYEEMRGFIEDMIRLCQ